LNIDLVEPAGASEAVHHSTILSGDSFSDEELARAQNLAQSTGMPSSVSASQVARLLRAAGAGRVVGHGTVKIDTPRPLADEKRTIRRLVNQKVARLHAMTDVPYSHIHSQLNKLFGDTAKTATAETLSRRLETLDRWIEEHS